MAVVKHGTGFHNHKLVAESFQLYSLAWSKVGGILKAVHFQTRSILLHHQPGFKRVKSVDMDTIISKPVSSRQRSCMNPSILIVGCIHVFSSEKFKFPKHWLKIAIIKKIPGYIWYLSVKNKVTIGSKSVEVQSGSWHALWSCSSMRKILKIKPTKEANITCGCSSDCLRHMPYDLIETSLSYWYMPRAVIFHTCHAWGKIWMKKTLRVLRCTVNRYKELLLFSKPLLKRKIAPSFVYDWASFSPVASRVGLSETYI